MMASTLPTSCVWSRVMPMFGQVDVDKFDYFSRDCYHLGMAKSFDPSRLMKFSHVIKMEGEGVTQIVYHEKVRPPLGIRHRDQT